MIAMRKMYMVRVTVNGKTTTLASRYVLTRARAEKIARRVRRDRAVDAHISAEMVAYAKN